MSNAIQMYDGVWIRWGTRERWQCCGCGLVHSVEVKRIRGELMVRMSVNNRSTGQAHRQMDARAAKKAKTEK